GALRRLADAVWLSIRYCDRDGSFISDHATLWMAGAGFAYGDCRRGCVLDGSGNFLRLLSGANGGATGSDRGVEVRAKPSWAVGRWPFVRCNRHPSSTCIRKAVQSAVWTLLSGSLSSTHGQ